MLKTLMAFCIAASLLLLASCASTVYVPKVVAKSVPVYCKPVGIKDPELPLVRKKPYSPREFVVGETASIILLKNEVVDLRGALKKCEGK